MAFSRPAHPRVTQTVGRLGTNNTGKGKVKIVKAVLPVFLIVAISASCSGSVPTSQTIATGALETAVSAAWTNVAETQLYIPTATPLLPLPVSSAPTTIIMDNGLTWTECSRLKQDYAYSVSDMKFAADCFKRDRPVPDDNDKKLYGERIQGEINNNLRMVIGKDIYETRFSRGGDGADYELLKNGKTIAKTSAAWTTFDPNRNLWNIGGKVVWEVANPSVLIIDGVNQNEKYQFEGTFFPYAIKNKLIYIAKKSGKYIIVYDEKVIGPEFDQISMAYCCGNTRVIYGQGQYWFWGRREGKRFVVAIH